MPPYQERVVEEFKELAERASKLNTFLMGSMFDNLPRAEQFRMVRQHAAMKTYAEVLRERIAAFAEAGT